MEFLTEFFSRPRHAEVQRYRAALETLNAMSKGERTHAGVAPPDFPRIGRRMAGR